MKKLLSYILGVLLIIQVFVIPDALAGTGIGILPIRTVSNSHTGVFYCVRRSLNELNKDVVMGVILEADPYPVVNGKTVAVRNFGLTGSFRNSSGLNFSFNNGGRVIQRNFLASTYVFHGAKTSTSFTMLPTQLYFNRGQLPRIPFVTDGTATNPTVTCPYLGDFRRRVIQSSLSQNIRNKLIDRSYGGERDDSPPPTIKAPIDEPFYLKFKTVCFSGTRICIPYSVDRTPVAP